MKKKKKMKFKAEIKQLLDILVNSLYTHKEIFLRELISNASDALDKVRVLSLTDSDILEGDTDLHIFIEANRDAGTLTISDNGIGMSYDEVIENIGMIAQSSSKRFLDLLKSKQSDGIDLIGQFGVGFYSVFMVADKVTIKTQSPRSQTAIQWESTGDGSYSIEEALPERRGTDIILKLKEMGQEQENTDDNFFNQYTIQKHIQKYCNFISYPIKMNWVTEEPVNFETNEIVQGETRRVITETILNAIQPLWERNKKDITRDEYIQLNRQAFHDWEEPAEILHFKGEGMVQFSSLLFIPSHAPYDLYTGNSRKGIRLYSKHVLVMNDCDELLPDYLRFVHGIVDSADLTLNISRETLQYNRQLQTIGNFLEKKVLDTLSSILLNDRQKYEKLWSEYGKAIKGGIFMEPRRADKLSNLLLFESSYSEDQKTTLKEYVNRMPKEQKVIYYIPGKSRPMIQKLPQMEVIVEKKWEVLYFLDKVDEFLTQHLREYEGKKLKSVCQGDLELDNNKKEGEDKIAEEDKKENTEEDYKDLTEFMTSALEGKVKKVRISKRLRSSPTCLVCDEAGYTLNMERLMREANQTIYNASKILEINPNHRIIQTIDRHLKNDYNKTKLSEYCCLLYDQSMLIETGKVDDPIEFSNKVTDLLEKTIC